MNHLLLGLSMGILGSIHCIGMCGPLVIGFKIGGNFSTRSIFCTLSYHSGKILTYSIIGLVIGIFSSGVHLFLSQQQLSVFTGILLLIYFISYHYGLGKSSFLNPKINAIINSKFSAIFKQENIFLRYLMIGIINGFLPCGLVYAAALASGSTGHITESMLFMIAFGIGTIPSLSLVIYLSKTIMKSKLQFVYKYLTLIVAILLIMRGLNLGIPYISPKYDSQKAEVSACCKH